jgi:hypothetical protein
MVMAQKEVEQARWNWPEALMERIPANYLLVSYISFILLFSIYYLFSRKVILFEWQNNTWYVSQSLAKSFLIPFLIAGLFYLSEKTRGTFKYIDLLYGNLKNDYFARIEARIIGEGGYHLLLLLSVVAPFIMMSWGQWPYSNWEPDNDWALRLDIYNYLLSFLILALLTELLWLVTNIIWSINEIGCASSAFSTAIDVFGMSMKLRPLRNFFLIFIVYYFIAIALVICTYMSPGSKMSIEPIYFLVLLILGGLLFAAGLEAIQRIIDCRVENELDILNNRREEQDHRLLEVVSSGNSSENAGEIEYISNVLEVIQKERDSLLQVNRRAYDFTSVGLFISSFLIPLLTLLGMIHK